MRALGDATRAQFISTQPQFQKSAGELNFACSSTRGHSRTPTRLQASARSLCLCNPTLATAFHRFWTAWWSSKGTPMGCEKIANGSRLEVYLRSARATRMPQIVVATRSCYPGDTTSPFHIQGSRICTLWRRSASWCGVQGWMDVGGVLRRAGWRFEPTTARSGNSVITFLGHAFHSLAGNRWE